MMIDVLITGADTITGYNTGRAIRDPSICLWGIANRKDAWECKSNLWSELFFIETGTEPLLKKLLQIGTDYQAKHGHDKKIILFPSQDYVVEAISLYRQDISRYYNFVLPEHEAVERLLDKTLFHEWALSEGFLVPKSVIVSNNEELISSLEKLRYPIIIKPLVRTEAWDKKNKYIKGVSLNCATDLDAYPFDLFAMCDRYIVQEWIEGGDDQIYFCLVYFDKDGKERASFTGKKLLQWPLANGSTSICQSFSDERLRLVTHDVLSSAGLFGLGSLEFKYSQKYDQYFLIEPTVGRNDHQSYIAVCAGLNISKIALDDLHESGEFDFQKEKPAIWVDEIAALRGIKQNKNFHLLMKVFGMFFTFKTSFAAFSLSDPKPFFHLIIGPIKSFSRKIRNFLIDRVKFNN